MPDKEQTWVEELAEVLAERIHRMPDEQTIKEMVSLINTHIRWPVFIESAANEIWGLAYNGELDSKEKIVEVLVRRQKAAEQFKEEPLIHLTPEDTVYKKEKEESDG